MEDKYPLVSIIIPLYNAELFIIETIDSILSQTYNNFEIIVIDNASTDNSIKLIKNLKNTKIRIISLKINSGGPAKPRNIGIENSNGEYIAFLDSDDIWHKDKLKIQIDYMLKYKYNFTSTNSILIDKNSKIINSIKYKILDLINKGNSKKNMCDLVKNKFIATSSVIVKKEFISLFNQDKELISVEDLCLWLTLFNKVNIKYHFINDKLIFYRVLENSASSRKIPYQQQVKANICILKFILRENRYDMLNCFHSQIVKHKRISYIKKILGKLI